jgi:N-methylhydantoinase A/oxoprolinase/acetone carboxylase beta subunit
VAGHRTGSPGVEVAGVEVPGAGPAELTAAFSDRHRAFNGFDRPDGVVEVIALRARATGTPPVRIDDLPVPQRSTVVGPAVLEEPDCTVWIPPGWVGAPGGGGALVLRRVEVEAGDR